MTYVMSDIHGAYEQFLSLLSQINLGEDDIQGHFRRDNAEEENGAADKCHADRDAEREKNKNEYQRKPDFNTAHQTAPSFLFLLKRP